MSYSVTFSLENAAGTAVLLVGDFNYTYNVSPMLHDVGIHLNDWPKDRPASEVIPILADGLQKLEASPEKYRAMNPVNGWGDYDNMLEKFIRPMLRCAQDWPNSTVSVC